MTSIKVRNVSRRPQDIEGGRVLAHSEQADAPDSPHTRALIASGALIRLPGNPARPTRGGES